MSDFFRILRSALARRIAFLIVASALAYFGLGKAHAQDYSACFSNAYGEQSTSTPKCATRAIAYAQVVRACEANSGKTCNIHTVWEGGNGVRARDLSNNNTHWRFWVEGCPADRPWDETLKQCSCPSGTVQALDGQCKPCSSLNSEPGAPALAGNITRPFREKCVGGCMLELQSGGGCASALGESRCWGVFEYSGASCPVNPEEPPPEPFDPNNKPKEDCAPAGNNQTFCVRSDGQHCYTSSSGKKTCWSMGETGQKGNGPEMQKREPGPQPTPPNPNKTTNGDTYQPNGSSITTTTTINNTTITTTTTNYQTTNGTDADNQTTPPGDPGSGDDPGADTTAGGGGDCQSPPIVTGDAALGMVATQAWATRCAVEEGNAASVSGDVGDCESPFSVQGTNANAVKLRAMRAEICGENQPGWTKGDAPALDDDAAGDDVDSYKRFGLNFSVDDLDTSDMLGGGSCPSFTLVIAGRTISSTEFPYWCQAIAILRGLILLFGAYTAVRILMGGNS